MDNDGSDRAMKAGKDGVVVGLTAGGYQVGSDMLLEKTDWNEGVKIAAQSGTGIAAGVGAAYAGAPRSLAVGLIAGGMTSGIRRTANWLRYSKVIADWTGGGNGQQQQQQQQQGAPPAPPPPPPPTPPNPNAGLPDGSRWNGADACNRDRANRGRW